MSYGQLRCLEFSAKEKLEIVSGVLAAAPTGGEMRSSYF